MHARLRNHNEASVGLEAPAAPLRTLTRPSATLSPLGRGTREKLGPSPSGSGWPEGPGEGMKRRSRGFNMK